MIFALRWTATPPAEPAVIAATFNAVEGAHSASAVLRSAAASGLSNRSPPNLPLLAVDPDTAAAQLWFRDDFAPVPLADLMRRIASPGALTGLTVPEDAVGLDLWVNPTVVRENATVWLRFARRQRALLRVGTRPPPHARRLAAAAR